MSSRYNRDMKLLVAILTSVVLAVIVSGLAVWAIWNTSLQQNFTTPINQLVQKAQEPSEKPLQKYAIPELIKAPKVPSRVTITDTLEETQNYTSYLVTMDTSRGTITGQLNVPTDLDQDQEPTVILMARGFAPLEIYQTGIGTRNAAAYYASNGMITLAPDFLGYGESDPEPENPWEARFIKPLQVAEIYQGIKQYGIPTSNTTRIETNTIGLWGHSNGGQIVLTTLQILREPVPTALWAPVTAPFPYSVLFFGDELEDEGKAQRAWLAMFEEEYDVFDFTLTKHLDLLTGPIQLHHGSADDAALQAWSIEFIQKLETENLRREEILEQLERELDQAIASGAAFTPSQSQPLPPIDITFFSYPGADHNLQPGWDTVVKRDVTFFEREFGE